MTPRILQQYRKYNIKAKIWFLSLQICLVLVLVPIVFFLDFGTIFKNKIFCRDLFKNQNILQGLFFYKMGLVVMCHVCKSSQKWGQGPKPKQSIFAGSKNNNKKKLQGLKPK